MLAKAASIAAFLFLLKAERAEVPQRYFGFSIGNHLFALVVRYYVYSIDLEPR